MDEKRESIAEKNFSRYLGEEMIRKEVFREIVFQTYFRNAMESLKVAHDLLEKKTSYLWAVVCSYYSMFYIASAYLYKKGYKTRGERVHDVINEALIVVGKQDIQKHFLEQYEEEKDKALSASSNLIDNYENERAKRSEFQYETTDVVKEAKAKTSLERARTFVAIMRELINKP